MALVNLQKQTRVGLVILSNTWHIYNNWNYSQSACDQWESLSSFLLFHVFSSSFFCLQVTNQSCAFIFFLALSEQSNKELRHCLKCYTFSSSCHKSGLTFIYRVYVHVKFSPSTWTVTVWDEQVNYFHTTCTTMCFVNPLGLLYKKTYTKNQKKVFKS